MGEAMREANLRLPVVIGRMGADYHAWAIKHFKALEAELEEALRS